MKRSLSFAFLFSVPAARGFQYRQLPSLHLNRRLALSSAPNLALFASSFPPEDTSDMVSKTSPRFLLDSSKGGIRNIVSDYDVFLLDMWGVMHDGSNPYEGVLEVVEKLKEAGKTLIILSNSSKRRINSVKNLKKLGFSDDAFDEIITSGEVAHHLLRYLSDGDGNEAPSSWVPKDIPKTLQNLRAKGGQLSAFCFGSGDGDEEYLNSCGLTLAESMETADLIVARGTFVVQSATKISNKNTNESDYWDSYQENLELAAASTSPIPMVVCNPDKVRPDADKSPMPGTIGVAYRDLIQEKHGDNELDTEGLILSLGKPFSGVYDIALSSIPGKEVDKMRVVMIGDALETDVTGATVAGIDSTWVINDGVHNQAISEASTSSLEEGCVAILNDFNNEPPESTYAYGRKVSPTVVMPHFRW